METLAEALTHADIFQAGTTTPASISDTPPWRPQIDAYDPTLQQAADEAARFIAEMRAGAKPRWLTITGKAGTGKTMLARQIFAEAQQINPGNGSLWIGSKRRPGCRFFTETQFDKAVTNDQYLPEYLADEFLVVLDDLGSAREHFDRVADATFRLANERVGKWMLWTSNLNIREIGDTMGERVASRLIRDGNRGVRIKASDYALQNRPENTGVTTD